ncbi:MAG: thermonuclease family protein [Thermodesulfobacteriaceae bacterium]|nr:thermonuclease family protein [Thermodesulfobacteriaceae bacterium]MCX8042428.1 thermonuclease family protein [Thermodesulfobacteriaceae bacterium]MDW8136806.1 thermonuclease family protein [Thermodesulfobacterium sp.]
MKIKLNKFLGFLILLNLIIILSCQKDYDKEKTSDFIKIKVVKVVDGDTVILENGEKLRYAGINTLERQTESGEVEPFAEEAYQLNKNLVEGKELYLELSFREKDIYGRLLGELYFENGTTVSEILVQKGLALVCYYPGNNKYYEKYLPLQKEALKQRKGIFSLIDRFPKNFPLVGNQNSKRFHLSDCKEVKKIKKKISFKNLEEAFLKGYCPSRECFKFRSNFFNSSHIGT